MARQASHRSLLNDTAHFFAIALAIMQALSVVQTFANPTASQSGVGQSAIASGLRSRGRDEGPTGGGEEDMIDSSGSAAGPSDYYDYNDGKSVEVTPAEFERAYWVVNNAWKNLYKQTFGAVPDSIAIDVNDGAGNNVKENYNYNHAPRNAIRSGPLASPQMQYPVYSLPSSAPVSSARAMAKRFAAKRQMRYKQCFFNPVTCFGHKK